MIRPQAVVLPILREALPDASVVSVVPDVDYRTYPMVVVRRAGGIRNRNLPSRFAIPEVEMTAVSADGPVEAEELYEDSLDALYDAVREQITVEGVGYLHSIRETRGAAQTASPYSDTWMAEGAVQLGLRPASH